jgi:hypothetical protein
MSEENTFDDMAEDLFDTLGVYATYIPVTGDPVSCKINRTKDIDPQPIGFESQAWASADAIEYRLDEVGQEANRGDIFRISDVDYTVQAVIEGDERFVKVAVK